MKHIKINVLSLVLSLMSVLILVGCKKDKQENSVKGIYIVPTSRAASETYNINFSSTPQLISYAAGLPQSASANVQVSFSVDAGLITAFNSANKTTYSTLPAASVKLETGSTTISSGKIVSSKDNIVINSLLLNPDITYLLPVKISSVSGGDISLNSSIPVKYFVIKVKSPYEGNYTSNGWFYHPSSARAINGLAKSLTKTGAFSVSVDLGDLGASGYKAILTVDPATNNITISDAPAAAGTPYTMFTSGLPTTDPGYTAAWTGSANCNNKYDPATKTFYVRYGYMGSGGWRITEEAIKMN